MIKNNLAVILAERGLKMIDVINGTGINKNTISSLVNNKATGIQYETLDKICDFLDITPGELLIRYKFSINVLERDIYGDEIDYKLKVNVNDDSFETIARLKIDIDPTNTVVVFSGNILPLVTLPKEKVQEELVNVVMDHLEINDPEIYARIIKETPNI